MDEYAHQTTNRPAAIATSPKGGRAMVVDDDKSFGVMLSRMLKQHFDEVIRKEDGWEAWMALNKAPHDFDLVCSDIRMPRMDGTAFLRKAVSVNPDIPVVMITGHGDFEVALQTVQDGARDFINKPFGYHEIERIALSIAPAGDALALKAIGVDISPSQIKTASTRRAVTAAVSYLRSVIAPQLKPYSISPHQPFVVLSEAMNNSLYHGSFGMPGEPHALDAILFETRISAFEADPKLSRRKITVEFDLSNDQLILRVSDEGDGFDVDAIATPDAQKLRPSGIPFMRSLCDELSWKNSGKTAVICWNLKRRDSSA